MLELIRVENPVELRAYIAKLRDQSVAAYLAPLRPYQYIYYFSNEEGRIGLVDIHHLPGRADARIGALYLENKFRSRIPSSEVLSLIEEKAKKLGAITLEQTVDDYPEALLHTGWSIAHTSYLMKKKL